MNVSGEYEPLYVPPQDRVGFEVGVGDGVTGGGNVSVGVGVTSGVGVSVGVDGGVVSGVLVGVSSGVGVGVMGEQRGSEQSRIPKRVSISIGPGNGEVLIIS